MKKIIFFSVISLSIIFEIQAQEKVVPAELKPFIEKGFEVLDFAKGDLDGDKFQDYVLILKIQGEDTITFDNINPEPERPLLIIIRQADKKLKKVEMSNGLVLCKTCGGMMGDPYQGISVGTGKFSINFYGGSSWRWSDTYTFQYDKILKNWYLEEHASVSYHTSDPNNTSGDATMKRSEIGDVTLQQFTPYYNSDSSSWKANAAKTYFYASPDIKSAPKKAYLVKGNEVQAIKQFKNFIECAFTNAKGNTTEGFLLKKDLVLIKQNN